jgi:hypothetical protein
MICRAYTSHKLPRKNSPKRVSACSASLGSDALWTRCAQCLFDRLQLFTSPEEMLLRLDGRGRTEMGVKNLYEVVAL